MGHDEVGSKYLWNPWMVVSDSTMLTGSQNFPKSPRGVRGFQLNTGNFSTWKLQGKVGGYTGYIYASSLGRVLFFFSAT